MIKHQCVQDATKVPMLMLLFCSWISVFNQSLLFEKLTVQNLPHTIAEGIDHCTFLNIFTFPLFLNRLLLLPLHICSRQTYMSYTTPG